MADILFNDGKLVELSLRRIWVIGRSRKCDYTTSPNDLAVSNVHCTLYLNDRKRWVITDGDLVFDSPSRGGVYINGEILNAKFGKELTHKDKIKLSNNTYFEFLDPKNERQSDGDTVI